MTTTTRPTTKSTKTVGRVVGGLFISGFLFYGGGSFLTNAATGGATPLPENASSTAQLSVGAALMLANSVAVVAIGALVFRVLRGRRTASSYLATRGVEGILLALAPLSTLVLVMLGQRSGEVAGGSSSGLASGARAAVENSEPTYWTAMAVLGVGSVFLCRTLLRSHLLPRLLAVWGIVGYAILATGSVLQLAGDEVGLVLSAPGGLFELAVGSYLLVKGFGEVTRRPGDALGSLDDQDRLAVPATVGGHR